MKLKKLDCKLTVCKVASVSDINLSDDFYFIGRTYEEISVVCETSKTPNNTTFYITGTLDFSLTGILSELSGILAENKIGIFAVSTYNTDYILVKEENFERALNVLAESGYNVL